MKKMKPDVNDTAQVELNLKRAVIDMLVLQLLHERDMYVKEIVDELECQSGGMFKLVCPYNIITRMVEIGYILELPRRIAPDGRRRQYYSISEEGKIRLKTLSKYYHRFTTQVSKVMVSDKTRKGTS